MAASSRMIPLRVDLRMKKILRRLKNKMLQINRKKVLDGNGERVDILYDGHINFDTLDMYQKSHYRRYEFAKDFISSSGVCGDFACGTGYGSVMLAEKSQRVIGGDIDSNVINEIKKRYKKISNVEFINTNLLGLEFESLFDTVVSFETIEHLKEGDIPDLFKIFNRILKPGGRLIFSTPYMQERSSEAISMGFHLTFNIDEKKIKQWLSQSYLVPEFFKYQNYQTHTIQNNLEHKDFFICVAEKQ